MSIARAMRCLTLLSSNTGPCSLPFIGGRSGSQVMRRIPLALSPDNRCNHSVTCYRLFNCSSAARSPGRHRAKPGRLRHGRPGFSNADAGAQAFRVRFLAEVTPAAQGARDATLITRWFWSQGALGHQNRHCMRKLLWSDIRLSHASLTIQRSASVCVSNQVLASTGSPSLPMTSTSNPSWFGLWMIV